MTHAKGRKRRRQAIQRPAPAAPPTARFAEMRAGRALGFPLAFTLLLALFGSSPSAQANPALLWSFLSAAGGLLAWSVALLIAARRARRVLSLDVVLRKQHYVQACAQLSVFVYWGWYWRDVYDAALLIAAQLVFAYAFDMLLTWSRRERYTLGFGPFPIIFSINLFLWFKVEWFYWQFVMIAIGFAAKELLRWGKNGRSAHIFNPSSFPLGLFSLVLLATGTTDLTWGPEIATTLIHAPHIYLLIFAVSLPAQVLFGVASMTLAAVTTTYGLGLVYFATTGAYLFGSAAVPIAVFLGMHLLFNDPSTSPRTELGRILFGVLYGFGVMILFGLLEQVGAPTHYDKLLAVPILNLLIKGIDLLPRSNVLRRVDPATIGTALSPRRRNLAYVAIWVAVFAIMQVQTSAQVALTRADQLFSDGETEAAIVQYRELIRDEPDYARAYGNLGFALRTVGRPVEAVAPLERAVELEPAAAETLNNLGLALTDADRLPEAVEVFQRALRLQPDYPEAHHNLGEALFQDGQPDTAIARYRELLGTAPDYAPAHNSLGYALLSTGRAAEALAPLQRAVELDPDIAEAHNNLGYALLSTGRAAEALAPLQRAVELDPDIAEAHHNAGLALVELDRLREATEAFRQALRLQPDYPEARHDLGLALFRDGQTEAATATYRELVRAAPDYAPGHNSLGYALLSAALPAEAVPSLRRAVELAPDNAEAFNNLGLALILTAEFPEAVEPLQRAVLLQPDYAEAHYNLAHAFANLGDAGRAVGEFRAALRNRPDYVAASRDLALLLATSPLVAVQDAAEAVRLASHAAELTGMQDPAILYVLARAYAAEGRFDEAIRTAETAARLVPDATSALAGQIEAHLRLYRQGRQPPP